MKNSAKYQGSLLRQITVPTPAKREARNDVYITDDFNDDTNVTLAENLRQKVGNSVSSFEGAKNQEDQVKSDSIKRKSKVSSSSDHSQDLFNTNSFNSADKEKTQPKIQPKTEKKVEQTNKSNKRNLLLPSKPKDDSTAAFNSSHSNLPQAGFVNIPKLNRAPKQHSSSNANPRDLLSKNKPVSTFKQDELNQNLGNNQDSTEKAILNEDLVKKMAEPIRRRLVVNLPTDDFEARRIQVTTALDMTEHDVDEISENVREIHDSLVQLSRDSRGISEKSMDLTQTSEAVLSKVNVMADWIDGLEKVGSGLKIQLIEWIVKFVSFLSSLLLLIYQTIRKANPLALLRKKGKKKPPLKAVEYDENS